MFIKLCIDTSVRHTAFVLILTALLGFMGMITILRTPVDAIPDLSDTQVIVRGEWAGLAAPIIEDQVTYPLSSQLLSVAGVDVVRGISMFGVSFVYVIFEDDADLYWARSRVLERLSQIQSQMPEGVNLSLGPDATGVGWVLQYALYDRSGEHDLAELRSLQDWMIKLELESVSGVAEVAAIGGHVKEYQVLIDPDKLKVFDISLADVRAVVKASSSEGSGKLIEMGDREYVIRSQGYISDIKQLAQSVVSSDRGRIVVLSDVARVVEGGASRRGVADLNGEGEVVGGIVLMRHGGNAYDIARAARERLDRIRLGLPKGVEIKVVYDRSNLIVSALQFLRQVLIEESIAVFLIIFLFLMHARSALIVVAVLPLGVAGAMILMQWMGMSANIMSLGGIAIALGAMVDAAIVMVENAHRRLSKYPLLDMEQRRKIILESCHQVGGSVFFSLLIMTVSFAPMFSLNGDAGKLFQPLILMKTLIMAVACVLSVTVIPVLMVLLMKGNTRAEKDFAVQRWLSEKYRSILKRVLLARKWFICGSLVVMCISVYPAMKIGSEFMPALNEGDLLYMPMSVSGISVSKAGKMLQISNALIRSVPEVELVFGKAGRANTATDPAPLAMIETWIRLKPKDQWREGLDMETLQKELDRKVRLPGLVNSWGYPIKIRLDMLKTGIRSPIGIKISGKEYDQIQRVALQVETLIKTVDGARGVIADRALEGRYVDIQPDRRKLAQYGLSMHEVQQVVNTALGGEVLGYTIEGRERYGMSVRYERGFRENLDDIHGVWIRRSSGEYVTLGEIANIQVVTGPVVVKSEDAKLNGWVFVDFEQRDMMDFVSDVSSVLKQQDFPDGVLVSVSGDFEKLSENSRRLWMASMLTFIVILMLLYAHFQCWAKSFIVMAVIPFSLLGGVWWMWLAGYNFSIASAAGFIALAGLGIETAIVMMIYLDMRIQRYHREGRVGLENAILDGAADRLRPKLMTVLTVILGLIPIFLNDGTGSEVMRRIALPMVGGMMSTVIVTLFLVPVMYRVWFVREQ